ncbi:MAG TPA: hydroxymethylbilane synthase [Chthoniobacteraceae bacterium]|nr:hydroxymethylbilane synthase [Chthoniobacteraceae bacterium]
MTRLILGSRGSALALAQVELTRAALARALPELAVEVKTIVTRGDKKLDLSLVRASEAGGKGLFTKELEDALLAGTIDAAVHSLKDLPGHNPPGLAVTAILERASTADVLVSRLPGGFDALPRGAVVGTSSDRRARQLRWLRMDLQVEDWRGNVQTRLRKLGENEHVAAIVLAQAGLERLGFNCASGTLDFEPWKFHVHSLRDRLLPAIGQGAIALQSRADRSEVTAILQRIDHAPTHIAIRAERELQRLLAGDCTLPVGIRTELAGHRLLAQAILFSPDETAPPSRAAATGDAKDPEQVAAKLFERLLPQAVARGFPAPR